MLSLAINNQHLSKRIKFNSLADAILFLSHVHCLIDCSLYTPLPYPVSLSILCYIVFSAAHLGIAKSRTVFGSRYFEIVSPWTVLYFILQIGQNSVEKENSSR
jgi:hypothetical protein